MIKKLICAALLLPPVLLAAGVPFLEPPASGDEWGFRPAAEEVSAVTPSPFVWRPQSDAGSYELEYARDPQFTREKTTVPDLAWNVHCPNRVMKPGTWFWRVRFLDRTGTPSEWSSVRRFAIADDAAELPMPSQEEVDRRIPQTHPRVFLRPEELPGLRKKAAGELKEQVAHLIAACDRLMRAVPDTSEPPKYPETAAPGSIEWRKIWWGNRMRTLNALDGAATLGFGYRLTGNHAYGELAKKILLGCAKWDPRGSTGRAYNDEAGIPYLSRFSRTYDYVYELLTEAEREECRRIIRIRGNEAFQLLYPRHFYRPYVSHSNRLWHFLGEAGVAFYNEIPEAKDWFRGALNVYFCVYPVWGDDDGGWHEGLWYWEQYLDRFFYWGDVMRSALGINVCAKPFFARTGYYPMYCEPPGTGDGGFGDLSELYRSDRSAQVMRYLAMESGNPYWQWYADRLKPQGEESAYVSFLRGTRPKVNPKAPTDLPTSRCFRGNGLAFLNTDLSDGGNNVQLLFKSSPQGTASHGFDANNSFILNAFGERLLIHSGIRDYWGSPFHRNWMWDTKSVNGITVNGISQKKGSFEAKGGTAGFSTGKRFDYVSGEAADSYPAGTLKRFRRQILFCKPSAILVVDTLEAPESAEFAWHLHAVNPMKLGQNRTDVTNAGAACRVDFLHPTGLKLEQTDQFIPNPARKQPNQYHLTAIPAEKSNRQLFLTLLRPRRTGEPLRGKPVLRRNGDRFDLSVELPEGTLQIGVDQNGDGLSARIGNDTFQSH